MKLPDVSTSPPQPIHLHLSTFPSHLACLHLFPLCAFRYFSTWKHRGVLEVHPLSADVRAVTGQVSCPFGDGALRCTDALLAAETCEELFTPQVRHAAQVKQGLRETLNRKQLGQCKRHRAGIPDHRKEPTQHLMPCWRQKPSRSCSRHRSVGRHRFIRV